MVFVSFLVGTEHMSYCLADVLQNLLVGMVHKHRRNQLVHLQSPVGTELKQAVIQTVLLVPINPIQFLAVRVGMKVLAA